jgi:hypothetical protein
MLGAFWLTAPHSKLGELLNFKIFEWRYWFL